MRDLKSALISSGSANLNKAATLADNKFSANRDTWISRIVDNHCKYNEGLNEQIAKLASENKLNDEQISRLVQESNTRAYLNKYASVKTHNIRRVEFPIASLDEVKNMLNKPVEKKAAFSLDDTSKGDSLDKTASAFEPEHNMFNSSDSYDAGGYWSADYMKSRKEEIMKTRIREKLAADSEAAAVTAREFLYKVASVGDSIITYIKMGYNGQQVFDKIASEASLDKAAQQPIRQYVKNRSEELKSNFKLAKNANCDLQFVEKAGKQFTMGKHSLLDKFASDMTLQLPDVIDGRGSLRTYESLVSQAQEIKDIVGGGSNE